MVSKKNKPGVITTPNFKLYYEGILKNTVLLAQRQTGGQQNRKQDSETCSYDCHLGLPKEPKNTFDKRQLLQHMVPRKLHISVQNFKLCHYLSPGLKINFQWIKDLCMSCNFETFRGNILEILEAVITGKNFPNWTPIAQETAARMHKWDYVKLKILHIKGINQQHKTVYSMAQLLC